MHGVVHLSRRGLFVQSSLPYPQHAFCVLSLRIFYGGLSLCGISPLYQRWSLHQSVSALFFTSFIWTTFLLGAHIIATQEPSPFIYESHMLQDYLSDMTHNAPYIHHRCRFHPKQSLTESNPHNPFPPLQNG